MSRGFKDVDLQTGCHPFIHGIDTAYDYTPSMAAGIVFCVLFGLSMCVHTAQFVWKRTWWCAVFSVGCLTELIGWAARTWSADCPYNMTAFMMQISTLIIAPVFFTAGIYVLLGRFIQILGRETSVIGPSLYLWIFCTCDVISLVIQAIGGGMASAGVNDPNKSTEPGTNTMVGGIVFQLASITAFVILASEFVRRSIRRGLLQSTTRSIVPLLAAMVLSVACIYIRSIYRTIELIQGWSGYLITNERFFIGLDGAMMVVAVVVFNFIHPGWLLPAGSKDTRQSHSEEGLEDGSDESKRSSQWPGAA